jgi:hypothetical protein
MITYSYSYIQNIKTLKRKHNYNLFLEK